MRVEIVAVGTELLLGQIADTNSQWLGEQLAAHGISSHFHQHVGDNHDRIVLAFRTALARSDAVIVCGGLGPTQDDITREAIAEVMGTTLEFDDEVAFLAIRKIYDYVRFEPEKPFCLTVAFFASHAEDGNPKQYLPQPGQLVRCHAAVAHGGLHAAGDNGQPRQSQIAVSSPVVARRR